jgi:hypothetical protein
LHIARYCASPFFLCAERASDCSMTECPGSRHREPVSTLCTQVHNAPGAGVLLGFAIVSGLSSFCPFAIPARALLLPFRFVCSPLIIVTRQFYHSTCGPHQAEVSSQTSTHSKMSLRKRLNGDALFGAIEPARMQAIACRIAACFQASPRRPHPL